MPMPLILSMSDVFLCATVCVNIPPSPQQAMQESTLYLCKSDSLSFLRSYISVIPIQYSTDSWLIWTYRTDLHQYFLVWKIFCQPLHRAYSLVSLWHEQLNFIFTFCIFAVYYRELTLSSFSNSNFHVSIKNKSEKQNAENNALKLAGKVLQTTTLCVLIFFPWCPKLSSVPGELLIFFHMIIPTIIIIIIIKS